MRNVYLGTSEFAAVVLRRLADSAHRPQLVVTRPDRPQGRGRRLLPPPVATVARELGIDVIQPEQLHAPEILERIAAARPEVLTTCAYGVLIKEPLLSDYEMINVHPSLLPRWRGAAPLERAIMAGDAETGVSIMRVTAGWDSGPVYLQERTPITPEDDYASLAARLETIGAELLVRALDERPVPREQDEAGVTYAQKITARDRALDPTRPPEEEERRVRALRPHIGARLPLPDGSFLGVIAARVDGPTRAPAGGLVRTEGDRLLLDCLGGALELTRIRPPGGRPMSAGEWLRGRPDPALTTFRLDPALPDRDLAELLELAVQEWRDDDREWYPYVSALAVRGGRDVLDALTARARDADPGVRSLAAYLLGQLGAEVPAYPGEQAAALSAMAVREHDPVVLEAIACGFGHLGEPYGQDWLLAQRDHPDARVREGVAFALGGRAADGSLGALIALSRDADADVRDWATFALGTLAELDTPELRDALAARVDDEDRDTRLEAIHGLALRRDARVRDAALDVLEHPGRDDVYTRRLLNETAAVLAEDDDRFERFT
ncbi:formyltransferase family protein [Candidatus Solirubrobacter pratensis]|uniref:formyltransferase family protein n=1 Tax=Candidatus Solirubrobacter pratensis TaxID=1298857 RepID=UPI00041C0694|nr:formyltransferase family protein [Candidatus Solirubrobacter pratensis]